MTASERAAGELVADVDTLTWFLRNRPALPPRELSEALVAAGFGNVAAARREIAAAERRGIERAARAIDARRAECGEPELLPDTLTEADRGGYIDGLSAAARIARSQS